MQERKHSAGVLALLLVAVSLLCIHYSWIYIELPGAGFKWNVKTWEVTWGEEGCEASDRSCLFRGDQLLSIDGYTLQEYRRERYRPTIDWSRPLLIEFSRHGERLQTVVLPRQTVGKRFEAVLAACFPAVFLAMAAFGLLVLRPRDERWLLQVTLYLCVAVFFAAGFLVFTRLNHAAFVSRGSAWLLVALLIHLHLILPAPLGAWVESGKKTLYGVTLLLLLLDCWSLIPATVLESALKASLLLALGILIFRLLSPDRQSERTPVKLMLFGAALGIFPWLIAMILFSLHPLEDLPFGLNSILIAMLSLIVLPNWPLAYICSIYKPDRGKIQFRGNRLLGVYGFFSISVATYVTIFFFVGTSWLSLREYPILSSLAISVFFLALVPPLKTLFQGYVDRQIFGIKYSPEEVVSSFARRIPEVFARGALEQLLHEEVLSVLSIRQSTLCLLNSGDVDVIYSRGLPVEIEKDLGSSASALTKLYPEGLHYIRPGDERFDSYPWLRLVVPFSMGDQTTGLWLLGERQPDNFYSGSDIELLENVAKQVSIIVRAQLEVAENQKLQQQLVQAQKMEAIGRLSAGIAHDFNNLLTAILSYSDLLEMQQSGDSTAVKYLAGIRDAGEKAEALTKQLLTFSRRQPAEVKVVDLNNLISGIERLLHRLLGEDVELQTRLECSRHVRADPRQIEQVILNLAVNANDAMPEGGLLSIETRDVAAADLKAPAYGSQRPHVCMKIRDTGVGIDPDIQKQMFEPFFTTKERTKGTGLGLAMVYGIVRQSNGFIAVESEKNEGASFMIYLPAAEEKESRDEAKIQPVETTGLSGAVILVVEDEQTVRDVACEILATNGFKVLRAADGLEALEVHRRYPGKIDLLLTDVVMPQMKGPELADRLLEMSQGLKVLFMSGYYEQSMFGENAEAFEGRLIRKPFSSSGLLQRIREALEIEIVPPSPVPTSSP